MSSSSYNIKMLCERMIFLFILAGYSKKDGKDNPCCQVVENSAIKTKSVCGKVLVAARLQNVLKSVIL